MRTFSGTRISYFIVTIVVSAVGGYYFGDDVRLAEKPAEYIAVIFSILAASLFATISIVGDPGMLVPGPAREAWRNAQEIQKELHGFNLIFLWYLLTLGLLVVSEVVEHSQWSNFYWVSNIFTFFAIAGFLFSFALPFDFMALQKRRLEQEIAARTRRRD